LNRLPPPGVDRGFTGTDHRYALENSDDRKKRLPASSGAGGRPGLKDPKDIKPAEQGAISSANWRAPLSARLRMLRP
jgi:hypothetical protein